MKAIVILNAGAGTIQSLPRSEFDNLVRDHLKEAGIVAEIRKVAGAELHSAVQEAAGTDVETVIVGGGDGTLSAAAHVLSGTGKALGILPLGTLNHLAKDLGIPLDLGEAIRVIAEGNSKNIDVGEVNDRVFVNNSSLGLYPLMVRHRESQQARDGVGKWPAMFFACLRVFRLFPLVKVRLRTPEAAVIRKTPLVFVGNNRYQLDLFRIGSRVCLDQGELSLYIATARSRWGMLKLTIRALLGRLEQSRDFESFCLSECQIETHRRRIHVAVDGEVTKMRSPLSYRVRTATLRVCLPRTQSAPTTISPDRENDERVIHEADRASFGSALRNGKSSGGSGTA